MASLHYMALLQHMGLGDRNEKKALRRPLPQLRLERGPVRFPVQ
jgi:hypothetical protein